jgi:hypothetical protein
VDYVRPRILAKQGQALVAMMPGMPLPLVMTVVPSLLVAVPPVAALLMPRMPSLPAVATVVPADRHLQERRLQGLAGGAQLELACLAPESSVPERDEGAAFPTVALVTMNKTLLQQQEGAAGHA